MYDHVFLVLFVLCAAFSLTSSFEKGKPTCDKYVQNVYLYAVSYMFLLAWVVAVLYKNPTLAPQVGLLGLVLLLLLYIGTYFAIMFVPKEHYILKHILALFYIALSGFILYTIFDMFELKSVTYASVSALVLFLVLTFFAFKFQNLISSKVSTTFVIVFIVMAILELIIGLLYPFSVLEKIIVFAVLMFVCYLLLKQTKRIIEQGATCVQPDYVKESISLVMTFKNILIRLLEIKGRIKK